MGALKLVSAVLNEMNFEWHARDGMLANISKVVYEYRDARGLLPLRLLVHGNDDLVKTEVATAIATEYKLPLISAKGAVAAAMEEENDLGADLKAAISVGPVPETLMVKVLSAALSTTKCRNQGYVLEGFPDTLAQATVLFHPLPAEGEEEAPAE